MILSLYGILARIINLFVKTKPKHWIFGSDYGNMYREGSKYLIEYMLKNHPDYHCTFITLNKNVKKDLDKGIKELEEKLQDPTLVELEKFYTV